MQCPRPPPNVHIPEVHTHTRIHTSASDTPSYYAALSLSQALAVPCDESTWEQHLVRFIRNAGAEALKHRASPVHTDPPCHCAGGVAPVFDAHAACQRILTILLQLEDNLVDGGPFSTPYRTKEDCPKGGLGPYLNIIDEPMDFMTIASRCGRTPRRESCLLAYRCGVLLMR